MRRLYRSTLPTSASRRAIASFLSGRAYFLILYLMRVRAMCALRIASPTAVLISAFGPIARPKICPEAPHVTLLYGGGS